MIIKIFLVSLCILLSFLSIKAQDKSVLSSGVVDSALIKLKLNKESNSLAWYHMFTDIPNNYYNLGKSYSDLDNSQSLFAILTATSILTFVDQDLWSATSSFSKKNPFINDAKNNIILLGDGRFGLLAAGLFSLYSLIANDKKHFNTSVNLVEALFTTGILIQLLKRTFGRESPAAATMDNGKWDLFPSFKKYNHNQPKYYAFPSGHIATLTATVTVIANNYPEEKWIKPAGYTAIGLVGFSLVAKGWHWYSDFPLGIYLGLTIGNIIAPATADQKNTKKNSGISLQPYIHPNYNGVQLIYNF
jgi:hypothetical protein